MNEKFLISIITPCYNQGTYIDEALDSIKQIATPYSFEHIIVNDGSTDPHTIGRLNELFQEGCYIISQKNFGLASARNNAIKVAKGKYIIALDADNKLHENYLTKAIDILENNEKIDVVYGNAIHFENSTCVFSPGQFKLETILHANYIDACAVFRKEVWCRVNGYDPNMPAMGNEDWEFWINCFLHKAHFYYLNEDCFYYRVRSDSMSVITTKPAYKINQQYIFLKHFDKIINYYKTKIDQLEFMRSFYMEHRYRTAIKLLFNSKFTL